MSSNSERTKYKAQAAVGRQRDNLFDPALPRADISNVRNESRLCENSLR